MSTDSDNPVGYARRLYEDVLGWYNNADSKAQVVLAIDGAFLAFLSGAIFARPSDVRAIVELFSPRTWSLLALMIVCLIGSVISAMDCLWSRTYSKSKLRRLIEAAQREYEAVLRQRQDARLPNDAPVNYAPAVMWFFQMITTLNKQRFHTTMHAVTDSFEIETMIEQIYVLAENVRKKHRAVNLGFVLAAATLILFFFAALSYLAEITP